MSEDNNASPQEKSGAEERKTTLTPIVIATGIAVLLVGVIFLPLFIAGIVIIVAGIVKLFRDGAEEKFAVSKESSEEKWPLEHMHKERIGVWVFIMSEILIFGSLITAYLYVRISSPAWPENAQTHNVIIGMVNTIVLLTSSLAIILAFYSIKKGNQQGLKIGLVSAISLGIAFLVIKLGFEWPELMQTGFTIGSGLPGSTYYLLTGVHAMHVAAGLVGVGYLLFRAFGGGFTADKHSGVENVGIYWHFVDIVWMFLFPLFYLI